MTTSLVLNPVTGSIDAAPDGPRFGMMTITPERAADILAERNTHNRLVSPRVVERYVRDMTAGAWVVNGDAIRFATDGTLLDGQHRLAAVVRSGVTIRTFVAWNLPTESQATMDDGRKRTMANVLQLDGHPSHSKTVASILRRLLVIDRDGKERSGGATAPTKAEMSAYYATHPQVLEAAIVADSMRAGRGIRCAASTLGVAYYLFTQRSPAKAAEFFDGLRTGAGLEVDSPILVLRNRLNSDGSTRLSTESPEVLAWFIKAWNAWRTNKPMKILRHKSGDSWPGVR